MCRIAALLGDFPYKRELMHQAMLLGSVEHFQYDGWGVTDGRTLSKSENPFYEDGCIPSLTGNHWLGHVRAASNGTELSKEAAHPYHLNCFYGVHNGRMDEVIKLDIHGPDTDSYRAFYYLARMCARDGIQPDTLYDALCDSLFAEWMNLFGPQSSFAFGILTRDEVIFIRNKERELWAVTTNYGTVVHSSPLALKRVLSYARNYYDVTADESFLLPKDALIRFCGDRFDAIKVDYKFASLCKAKINEGNKRRK